MMNFTICFFILLCITVQVLEAKKYKVKVISIDKCRLPEGKADKSEPVIYESSVRKINKQTFWVRPFGPILINFRIYQLSHTKDLLLKLEKMDCHNPFTYQLVRVVHLDLDNDCIAKPGTYSTDNINLQDFAWVLGKAMISTGKYIYEMEICTANGIALCNKIVCEILELK